MCCWLLRKGGELVLAGLMKKEEFPQRVTGIMWEVSNGIHMHQTRTALVFTRMDQAQMLDKLLCLQSVDLHMVKAETFNFVDDESFWKFVADNNLTCVIASKRLE